MPPAVIILVKKKRRRIIRYSRRGKAGEEDRQFVRRFPDFAGLACIAAAVARIVFEDSVSIPRQAHNCKIIQTAFNP